MSRKKQKIERSVVPLKQKKMINVGNVGAKQLVIWLCGYDI